LNARSPTLNSDIAK